MDIKEIKQIVDLMKKSELSEFAIEEENFKLKIKRGLEEGQQQAPAISYLPQPMAAPAAVPAASPMPGPATPAPSAPAADNSQYITSPMVGTFYAAPSPDSPAFIQVGDQVQEDTVVCIIEAMKIMNEILSEEKGSIAEILVEDGQPIEFGQKLFRLA
ncbi:acetyl-CoA carboxylase biotin carboxyl carrier protein [Puniceicoccaceae bacterium K14]|nr:acetyl-CoA carboxylase biotin carboxyl carrier protein [Puniceicoccaceae bacterium K14]